MGSLRYGASATDINFDDRALYHLQVVIVAKLRRGESFTFSWVVDRNGGSGRISIWLDPSSTLSFRYADTRAPVINREWIEALMKSANSTSGLFFSAEPDVLTTAR
ncbi:ATP-dependent DNA ligase [Cryobacterium sp. CG_9.6]|uniref:DUF7882 family protein n=1 Tax=Cryobacterium sp. CG_9.6 TaxID=2760710 RepID=UPI0024770F9B|nr:ATP-dependent DNA ligase [Cryobacterium sp. CG_9.6]MDH6237082.1 hypothetical protein [Cryobacterium sp. CG_9.6]